MDKLRTLPLAFICGFLSTTTLAQTGAGFASSEMSISDFTLTASPGALQPIGSASLGPIPQFIGSGSEYSMSSPGGGFQISSSPFCVGACGTGSNFVSTDRSMSSLMPWLTEVGASFATSTATQFTPTASSAVLPFSGRSTTARTGIEQQFTLSEPSRITVNFVAAVDLQAKITNTSSFQALVDPRTGDFTVFVVRTDAPAGNPGEMYWSPGTGIAVGTTVLSQPFDLSGQQLTNCSNVCPDLNLAFKDSGTFTAESTDVLTPGTYTLEVIATALQSSRATTAPEPATLGLMVLGLAGLGLARRKLTN